MDAEILNQTFGVEIEMYHITRARAAAVVQATLTRETGTAHSAFHEGGGYDAYAVHPVNGVWLADTGRWLIERDMSIQAANEIEKAELVTPILRYESMGLLQTILRDLRKAGARSDPNHMCGIHVHVGGEGHTPATLRNLANIMAAHEQLLRCALNLDASRIDTYCRPVDPQFLQLVNRKKPETMNALADIWYQSQGSDYARDAHYNRSRYHMLNLHSFFQHGNLEFRLFQFDNFDASAPAGHRGGIHAGQVKAYIQLCLALSAKAKAVRSASPRVLNTDNPKYAMRCWLLRLGFIGEDFATARELYTRRLEGDTAFRHGRPTKTAA